MLDSENRGSAVQRPPAGKITRNAIFLLASQIVTMALSVILSAAIGRGLGVVAFGNYFLLQTIATFAYVAVEWGQSAYLVREAARREAERNELLGGALVFRVVAGVLAALASAMVVQVAWDNDTIKSLTLLAVACGLPLILAQGYVYIFRALDRMELEAFVAVSNKVITAAATVSVLLLGAGLPAVFVMQSLGGVAALIMAVLLARSLGIKAGIPRSKTVHEFAVGGTPIAVFFLALAAQPFIDAIILSRFAPSEVVGWYGAARNIITLLFVPAQVLATAVFPEMSRVAESIPDLSRTLRPALRLYLGLAALGTAGTFLFADVAVTVIFGEKHFDPAIDLLKVFAPILPLVFMDVLFGTTLTAVGKTKEIAVVKSLSIIVGAALAFLLIPLCQDRFGNGAIGLMLAFGLSEMMMLAAFLYLLPRGALHASAIPELLRAAAAGAGTVAIFRILPVATPWLTIPASIALFAALAFALGLVQKEDVRKLAAVKKVAS